MSNLSLSENLENAVRSLCPLISERVSSAKIRQWSEEELLSEMICCVMSSQVPFEMAQSAVKFIRDEGLLTVECWRGDSPDYESRLFKLLSSPMSVGGRLRMYRFPQLRSKQISITRDTFRSKGLNLTELVFGEGEVKNIRQRLTDLIKGLGPKQASMFLRNVGRTYDLAILDRHIIQYMELRGLIQPLRSKSLCRNLYESIEKVMENYSKRIGYPTGYVDWAIWITMRAVREMN